MQEEQETQEEATGEAAESQDAVTQVVESTATPVEAPPDDQVKIVVTYKGGKGMVGVSKPDCDPVFSRIEGDLAEVIASVSRLVDQARATWETNPKYPKADLPAPPPPPPRSARPAPAAAPQSKAQPAFF